MGARILAENSWVMNCAPPLLPLYARAVFKGNRYREGMALPALHCNWENIEFPAQMLSEYCSACHLSETPEVPLLFPHMFLGGAHLQFMSHSAFPLKPLGAVHSRNHIVQYAPLKAVSQYQAQLKIGGQRRRPQGLEFDLHTSLSCEGKTCWVSVSTYLVRMKLKGEDAAGSLASEAMNLEQSKALAGFEVPVGTGKLYGRLSGDINPIHMSALLAKCFGFKRDLAHGMWSAARGNGFFEHIDAQAPIRHDVAFKGPLYLGEPVAIRVDPQRPGAFEFYGGKNERPSVVGLVRNVAASESLSR